MNCYCLMTMKMMNHQRMMMKNSPTLLLAVELPVSSHFSNALGDHLCKEINFHEKGCAVLLFNTKVQRNIAVLQYIILTLKFKETKLYYNIRYH